MKLDAHRKIKIDEGRPASDGIVVVYADNGATAVHFEDFAKALAFIRIHNAIVDAPPVTVEIDGDIRITDLVRGLTSVGLTFESRGGVLRIVKFQPLQVVA